jgi:hypothetical protein
MKNSLRRSLLGSVIAVASTLFLAGAANAVGPQSPLFLTAGANSNNWGVQGPIAFSGSQQYGSEYPIAVFNNKIRTLGTFTGSFGAEYNTNLTFDGTSFTNQFGGGVNVYDGTTDAVSKNYTVDYNSGDVYATDLNWSNPQFLFTTAPGFLGITYDPTDNSLWLSNFNCNVLEHRTLFGTLMSSFTTPFTAITCLALDPADNTLWMGSQSTQGTFYQYSKAGVQLSTVFYGSLTTQNTLGGEFQNSAAQSTSGGGSGRVLEVNANGQIIGPSGNKVTFSLWDVENEQATPQFLEGLIGYQDKVRRVSFQTGRITSVQASGNEAFIRGNANLAKSRTLVFFTIHVIGNQNPNTNDTFSISLSNGYNASGNVLDHGFINLTPSN